MVKDCRECSHFELITGEFNYNVCKKASHAEIQIEGKIPEWCPLEEEKGKNEPK